VSGKTTTIQRPVTPPAAADRGRSRLGDATRPVSIDRRLTGPGRTTVMLGVVAIAIAGALAAALFLLPVQTFVGQDERIAERGSQLAQLESVNSDLRAEVARLRTEDGVREAAREQLGYVQAGERRETIRELPAVPTDLPDGWPYSLITSIADLKRTGGAAEPSTAETP
jgi:hypothetical protein